MAVYYPGQQVVLVHPMKVSYRSAKMKIKIFARKAFAVECIGKHYFGMLARHQEQFLSLWQYFSNNAYILDLECAHFPYTILFRRIMEQMGHVAPYGCLTMARGYTEAT